MPFGVGSPDATPSENGFPANGGVANARVPSAPITVTDAANEPPVFSSVRLLILWSQSPVMPMTPSFVGAVDPFLARAAGGASHLGVKRLPRRARLGCAP